MEGKLLNHNCSYNLNMCDDYRKPKEDFNEDSITSNESSDFEHNEPSVVTELARNLLNKIKRRRNRKTKLLIKHKKRLSKSKELIRQKYLSQNTLKLTPEVEIPKVTTDCYVIKKELPSNNEDTLITVQPQYGHEYNLRPLPIRIKRYRIIVKPKLDADVPSIKTLVCQRSLLKKLLDDESDFVYYET